MSEKSESERVTEMSRQATWRYARRGVGLATGVTVVALTLAACMSAPGAAPSGHSSP